MRRIANAIHWNNCNQNEVVSLQKSFKKAANSAQPGKGAMLHTKFQVSSSPGTCFSKIEIWPKSAVNPILNVL